MAAKQQQRSGKRGADPSEGPERQCAVTRAVLPADDLIRFVAAPDGALVPDLDRNLPGRGVWLTARRDVVEKAEKTKAFARSLGTSVTVPLGLADHLDALLVRRLMAVLSLANKAGLVIAGFQQVDSALDKAGVSVLVHGTDAAEDGKGKLGRKFKAIQASSGRAAPVSNLLTIEQLSLALGRPSVVHAALIPGGLSERFLWEAERIRRFRASAGADGQGFSDDQIDDQTSEADTDIA